MGNPLWKAGMESANPAGRPKNVNSVRTVKGMVERFVKRNISPVKLQGMFNSLKEAQRLEMLLQLLPYVLPKVQADSLSEAEITALYEKLEKSFNHVATQKAI